MQQRKKLRIGDVIGVEKQLPANLLPPLWELRQIPHLHILMGLVCLVILMAGCLLKGYHLMYPNTKFCIARNARRLLRNIKRLEAQ